eukprot:NODE_34_length_36538_cov_0.612854.p27 type:complete len:119 gc:universal NODE_34_length_36538_cov_0.612854:22242-21886(-)
MKRKMKRKNLIYIRVLKEKLQLLKKSLKKLKRELKSEIVSLKLWTKTRRTTLILLRMNFLKKRNELQRKQKLKRKQNQVLQPKQLILLSKVIKLLNRKMNPKLLQHQRKKLLQIFIKH